MLKRLLSLFRRRIDKEKQEAEKARSFMENVYCLGENPFALKTAPDPDSKKWFFVDRELDIKESSATHLATAIEQFVFRLNNRKSGNRGLMVVGWWGSGKTHALNAVIREAKQLGFKTCKLDFRSPPTLSELYKAKEKSLDPLDAILALAWQSLGVKQRDTTLVKTLPDKTIVCLDQAENLPNDANYGLETFLRLLDSISLRLEEASANLLRFGIAITQTPETYRYIKERRAYVLDRFDRCVIPEDMNEKEAEEFVRKCLETARFKEPTIKDESKLYPFRRDSVVRILEFWRKERPDKRTMRTFSQKCECVFDYAVSNKLAYIEPEHVEQAIYQLYNIWRKIMDEWSNIKRPHAVLVHALYHALRALNESKEHQDVRCLAIQREIKIGSVRFDILVTTQTKKQLGIEVQISPPTINRYEKISTFISNGEIAGIVLICLTEEVKVEAERALQRAIKDPSKYKIVLVENEPEVCGQLLSFATLSRELGFPSEPAIRDEIKRNIKRDEMVSLLTQIGLVDAMRAIP
jgi:hypothetical protein